MEESENILAKDEIESNRNKKVNATSIKFHRKNISITK